MKHFFTILFCLSLTLYASAQVEQLTSVKSNPALYYSTIGKRPLKPVYKYLTDKGTTIVTSDTLTLPFIDDFSTNRTRSYRWVENHITDTFYNVTSSCLTTDGITTSSFPYAADTARSYFYVATLDSAHYPNGRYLDSMPLAQMPFTNFPPAFDGGNCFNSKADTTTVLYWPSYFRWEDSSGFFIDSIEISDGSVDYAPVLYFAQGERGTLWFDNYVYINNTYPIDPPTIGVATFDGLNEYGLPYNSTSPTSYGPADYLTSKPIDLTPYKQSDSIYLSFFYEPQGLGDVPDHSDSLVLEFKGNDGLWRHMWSDTGYANADSTPHFFKQVIIYVTDTILSPIEFYSPTFQFRFFNYASLSGNNDHWHIDYVRLDKGRKANDTIIKDIAMVYPMPSMLKNYTEMPAHLFTGPADLRDSIVLTIHNLDHSSSEITNPPSTNFLSGAQELYPTPAVTFLANTSSFNATPINFELLQPASTYTFPDAFPVDSMVVNSSAFIQPNDVNPQNDTVSHIQNMSDVLAYDDGSAERAYGLTGLGLKKFGYEFELPQQDTLAAFQVMFTQIEANVNDLVFDFMLWDSLRFNDYTFVDTPMFELDNKLPLYIDSVNGFATYVLDSPILIPKKFYFGWAQTDERSLQIGYDLNSTLGRQHMFYYTNAQWRPSGITPLGSLMIRLILDSDYKGSGSVQSIKDLSNGDNKVSIFPNPTSGVVNIASDRGASSYELSVADMSGRLVQHEASVNNNFTISGLPNGMYLVALRDINSGKTYHSKLIKASL